MERSVGQILLGTLAFASFGASAPLPVPAKVLDLSRWHETLPVDANGSSAGTADQINQPELATFQVDPWFRTVYDSTVKDTGVAFRAFAGGAKTSSNTIFARSELREHNADYTNTAWKWNDGLAHTMKLRQSIAYLTKVHPHTAAGQIHDESDDVFMLKAEATDTLVPHLKAVLNAYFDNSSVKKAVDTAYVMGTAFDLEVTQLGKGISVKYNGKLVVDSFSAFPLTTRGANYFKAGCYIQTNPTKYGEDPAAFAEVRIFSLSTTHAKPVVSGVSAKTEIVDGAAGAAFLYSIDGKFEAKVEVSWIRALRRGGWDGVRSGLHLLRFAGATETLMVP